MEVMVDCESSPRLINKGGDNYRWAAVTYFPDSLASNELPGNHGDYFLNNSARKQKIIVRVNK